MFTQFLYRVDNCSSCCHLCKLVKVLALSKQIFHLNDAEMCFFTDGMTLYTLRIYPQQSHCFVPLHMQPQRRS